MLNDVDYLKNVEIKPTDGEDITKYDSYLKNVFYVGMRNNVQNYMNKFSITYEYKLEKVYSDFSG